MALVDHRTGDVLSQSRVDEKTNEHKAVLPLLEEMVLRGRVIVGDAMFCQRVVCQQIIDSGGDYLLAVKENQSSLLREISLEFRTNASEPQKKTESPYGLRERPADRDHVSIPDNGHGRVECRTLTAYYITSLTRSRASAATLESLIRNHWGAIENGTHYVRIEAFGEDRCTIKSRHAPQNLAALRNTALNWLRNQGHRKITATLRRFTRNSQRLFSKLGHQN